MSGTPRLVASVDVGGTTIKGALIDEQGAVHQHRRVPVRDIRRDDLVATVVGTVGELLNDAAAAGTPAAAVGLAVPGVVDETAGVGEYSMILGWKDVPFVQLLRDAFSLPVAFGHDVSAGAYAEARRGAAAGHHDWLFLALGTGLGSTFVLNDRPYRGSGGTGGELAHVVCEVDGPLCRCGKRGCLEMVSSAAAVADLYALETNTSGVSAADVADRARRGEPMGVAVWRRAITGLATVVAGYVESMNPSAVVVGGGMSTAGPALLDPFSAALRDKVAFARSFPAVRAAVFGDLAALHGVAIRAHEWLHQPGSEDFAVPFVDIGVAADSVRPLPHHPTREALR